MAEERLIAERRISASDAPIAVINASSVMNDDAVANIVMALQTQVDRDYSKAWYCTAKFEFVPRGQTPQKGRWWLSILDDSDVSSALGYHDLTSEGLAIGKAFVKTDLDNGYIPSVTISHEALEMIEDPYIGNAYNVQTSASTYRNYALEVCDACEDDSFAYEINGVKVSDFVFPSWFVSGYVEGKPPFDFQRKITKPYELLQGGYIGYQNIGRNKSPDWNIFTAKTTTKDRKLRKQLLQKAKQLPIGSRRERRARGSYKWKYSQPINKIMEKSIRLLK